MERLNLVLSTLKRLNIKSQGRRSVNPKFLVTDLLVYTKKILDYRLSFGFILDSDIFMIDCISYNDSLTKLYIYTDGEDHKYPGGAYRFWSKFHVGRLYDTYQLCFYLVLVVLRKSIYMCINTRPNSPSHRWEILYFSISLHLCIFYNCINDHVYYFFHFV